jgi:hypothetical protein
MKKDQHTHTTDTRMNGQVDGQMDGWMGGWVGRRTDG